MRSHLWLCLPAPARRCGQSRPIERLGSIPVFDSGLAALIPRPRTRLAERWQTASATAGSQTTRRRCAASPAEAG